MNNAEQAMIALAPLGHFLERLPPLSNDERRKLAICAIETALDAARSKDYAATLSFIDNAIRQLEAMR